MNLKEVLTLADRIVFEKTGQHLDDLQEAVLRGTLQRETYKHIAKNFDCSESSVKQVGSELWQILSEKLGEDVNKKNFISAFTGSKSLMFQTLHKTSANNTSVVVLTPVEKVGTRPIYQTQTHQIRKNLTQNQLKLYIKI